MDPAGKDDCRNVILVCDHNAAISPLPNGEVGKVGGVGEVMISWYQCDESYTDSVSLIGTRSLVQWCQ